MQTDLNRLRIFHTIYALGSVSEAARKLHLSQPAVSQHLQKLESELEIQLFVRTHKKLIPTSAAVQLYTTINPFLTNLPETLNQIRHPSKEVHGLIRLGAPYEFGQAYLPDVCHAFRLQYPHVTFSITLGESHTLLQALKSGELDFAIIDLVLASLHLIDHRSDLFSMDPLIDEELTLVCSRSYYDREINGDHSYDNLIGKDFISDEHDDTFLRHWFRHHFKISAPKPRIVMTVESHQANLRCVKLGMGLSVTSSHMVWKEIRDNSIVPITTETTNAINTISLAQLLDKIPTVTERIFHNHIGSYMQEDTILRRFNILPGTADEP